MNKSECCDAEIGASLGDGVLIGSCKACGKPVCRTNPRTGANEWLDGESPWTPRNDLRCVSQQRQQRNIYVASSWRNEELQQRVVQALRADGHEVYDFRNPEPGDQGFSWKQISEDRSWLTDPKRFREGLRHPIAQRGFNLDMGALRRCDACVLVLPCGRSAHLELGWAAGAGKTTIVLLDDPLSEPELMYLACSKICVGLGEVLEELRKPVWDVAT